jgi:hypothetical protein
LLSAVIAIKLILEPAHACRSWNSRAVNQHRSIEIPVGEHLNVVEVSPDLIAALGVLSAIGAHIDRAAIELRPVRDSFSASIACRAE